MLTALVFIAVFMIALALFLFWDNNKDFICSLTRKEGQVKLVFKDRSKGDEFFNYMNVTFVYTWDKSWAGWNEAGRYYNATMDSFGTVRSGCFVGTIDEFEARINRRFRHQIEYDFYIGKLAEFRAQREAAALKASEDQPTQA